MVLDFGPSPSSLKLKDEIILAASGTSDSLERSPDDCASVPPLDKEFTSPSIVEVSRRKVVRGVPDNPPPPS